LKIEAQLGDGSFGIVHKGEWNRPSGLVVAVAVKVLKSDVIKKQEIYEDFVREVEAMHSLQHPSLIRYL
jgi:activated CDC42 kinase 1